MAITFAGKITAEETLESGFRILTVTFDRAVNEGEYTATTAKLSGRLAQGRNVGDRVNGQMHFSRSQNAPEGTPTIFCLFRPPEAAAA